MSCDMFANGANTCHLFRVSVAFHLKVRLTFSRAEASNGVVVINCDRIK